MLEDFAFICIVGESGRETEREREREKKDERDLSDRKLGPGESEQDGEEKRRELRGRLVVKMKAPPLVAAPFEDDVTVQLTPVYTVEEA